MAIRWRKSNRLKNFDYSSKGWYFITICTENRHKYFGNVQNQKMILNKYGEIANKFWLEIPKHYSSIDIDKFVIMPNHVHGIVIIRGQNKDRNVDMNVGTGHCPVPTMKMNINENNYGLLSKVINGYKNVTTKIIRYKLNNYLFHWQRSYYDQIIRNLRSLQKIRNYIESNPANWEKDRNNLTKMLMKDNVA